MDRGAALLRRLSLSRDEQRAVMIADLESDRYLRLVDALVVAAAEPKLLPEADAPAIPDATEDDPIGARGGQIDGIAIHSVRVRGLVAHQEVILGNVGETLTIRHDMPDRAAAAPGILAATRAVQKRKGLTVGLEHVLGLG